ncbi:carbohydrate ABC transporter permease [Paenibacillus eucommiae]|uniref:Multiple sugar transport system permease protein n=1 Tax=Paenibacillus eucommiae TaxID=1355755 RepID=A0ABS4J8T3_9BACL|nr:sugar ABC transporter permease [Paenibacillus eucommiae]MBP1996267.1 multiple sugar transport system permease protein [Paenibacillus eucommiae]
MGYLVRFVRIIIKERWAYYFILPGYLIFLIFNFIPMIRTFVISFYEYNLVKQTYVGFRNYTDLFADSVFRASVINSIKFALIITPISTVVSLLIAVTIFPMRNWMQSIFRGAFFLPNVVGGVIVSAVWLWIYHPVYGILNYLLSLFGAEPVYWLADVSTALFSASFVVLTWTCGTLIIIFVAALGAISPTLYEAAKIDGASPVRIFFRITLPMLKSITAFVVITQLIFSFQIWEVVYLLTDGGPFNSTTTLVFDMYKRAFVRGDYGGASAEGMILVLIISMFALLSWYLFSERRERA